MRCAAWKSLMAFWYISLFFIGPHGLVVVSRLSLKYACPLLHIKSTLGFVVGSSFILFNVMLNNREQISISFKLFRDIFFSGSKKIKRVTNEKNTYYN